MLVQYTLGISPDLDRFEQNHKFTTDLLL